MEIVGTIEVPTVIRSIKEQKKVLAEKQFNESDVLVLLSTTQKQYEMSESDFMKYATVVTDTTEGTDKDETDLEGNDKDETEE
jgi:hypothetical protein